MSLLPGAPAAVALGCSCRIIDNFWGRGSSPRMGDGRQYLVEAACPLHGLAAWHRANANHQADQARKASRRPAVAFHWAESAFHPASQDAYAETAAGRLGVSRHARPPDPRKPFLGTFQGQPVAFFASMTEGRASMETWYVAQGFGRPVGRRPK